MDVSGVTYTTNVVALTEEMQKKIDKALEVIGGKAEGYAKKRCPVDTGNLRNSITHQQRDKGTEVIGSNVEYAPYVELGTRKMRPRAFLRPAAENHASEYRDILLRILKE